MGRRHAPGAAAERPEVLTDVLITGIHPSGAGIARLSDSSNSRDVPEILVPGALPGARGDLFWNPPKPGGHWGLAVEWRESAPSPDADPSRCPHAASLNGQPVCGGCPLGSLKYSAELALKTKLLIEEPLRQAGLWREGLIRRQGSPKRLRSISAIKQCFIRASSTASAVLATTLRAAKYSSPQKTVRKRPSGWKKRLEHLRRFLANRHLRLLLKPQYPTALGCFAASFFVKRRAAASGWQYSWFER